MWIPLAAPTRVSTNLILRLIHTTTYYLYSSDLNYQSTSWCGLFGAVLEWIWGLILTLETFECWSPRGESPLPLLQSPPSYLEELTHDPAAQGVEPGPEAKFGDPLASTSSRRLP